MQRQPVANLALGQETVANLRPRRIEPRSRGLSVAVQTALSPAAVRQFVEGDVQDWWLPHSGKGVRAQISDDRPWLADAVVPYVEATQDELVLEPMAFERRVVDGAFQFKMRVSAPVRRIVDLRQWIWKEFRCER
ncbi:MAG: hypothetical protein P4L80_02465 [Xanthobacteraceae bacterium]|nr:hypothetical protein [Xanthobacteraceae bacterium]